MMDFYRWVAKHKILTFVLLSGIEILIYSFFFYSLNVSTWLIVLIDFLIMFINYMFVESVKNVLLKKPLDALLKQGDPEPLLFATQELLTFKNSESSRQLLLINHCTALRNLGELERARDILKSINIDKVSGTLPVTKAVYYNNLSDIFALLGDNTQAELWYLKMMQIYNDMPGNRFKKGLNNAVIMSTAEYHFRKGEYSQVQPLLNRIQTDDLTLQIGIALLCAETSLKQNDIETAKERLSFVINNGNKLYAVKIAQKLLNDL